MSYSITKFGIPLDKSLYTIDEKTKTFSSNEWRLVLDFINETGWTFKTDSNCTFNTGSCCTFNTGYNCTFKTGRDCTFKTDSDCTFDTDSDCTFNTGSDCTFDTFHNCTFNTGSDCVVVRRDRYEVIELKEGIKIKLNNFNIKGYTVIPN